MPVATMATPSTRSRYTYDQFRQAAQSSGLLGEFSDADLSLAQQNPDAGMSLLGYKRDWHNAATDAERNLANLGAEGIRTSYGNYTGGVAGINYGTITNCRNTGAVNGDDSGTTEPGGSGEEEGGGGL